MVLNFQRAGQAYPFAAKMSNRWEVYAHRDVTSAVHKEGGKIAMQILHTGNFSCGLLLSCVFHQLVVV